MQPVTQAEMFDDIRRLLGRGTARDAGIEGAQVGEPHPNALDPDNAFLRQCIKFTLADVNVRCGLGGNDKPLPTAVAAQTANGPLQLDLSTAFGPLQGQVNRISRVWWDSGTLTVPGTITYLTPDERQSLDRGRYDAWKVPPSVPRLYWCEGYHLWVSPAPSVAGILYCLAGTALLAPATDDDYIQQLPGDLNPVIIDGAALRVCVQQPDDSVMRDRAAILRDRYERGVVDIRNIMNTMARTYQPRITAFSYRVRSGRR
jgi:hypothetical protein